MPTASGSSRVMTLVSTDLVGSTSLKAEKGDDRAGELIARHCDHVKKIAEANHGRIINWAEMDVFSPSRPSAAVRFPRNLRLGQGILIFNDF